MDIGDRRTAWALLSRAARGPCRSLQDLVAAVGVESAAEAVLAGKVPNSVDQRVLERADLVATHHDLEVVAGLGGRLVTPDDAEWPAECFAAFADPVAVSSRVDCVAPLALWVLGSPSLRLTAERGAAVIGARCSTDYGNDLASGIAADFVQHGLAVVSGAAYGIDAAGARGAVAAGGTAVAVLPTGLDRPYPAQLRPLIDTIASTGGLVVSELPPGTVVSRADFPHRNRLTAALSRVVVVVEAGLRSGTVNTVGWAGCLGRAVYATPGPVTSAASAGCHQLIREGLATLVTCADEVIAAV
ncbi:DNA-processing protein DprA [Nocardia brasiliensis]